METKDTTLQYVTQDDKTLLISPTELSKDELKEYYWYSDDLCKVRVEKQPIPVVVGVVQIFDDGAEGAPHILYECPRCKHRLNADLYEKDPNPRFAWCDICQWDSVMWIKWKR